MKRLLLLLPAIPIATSASAALLQLDNDALWPSAALIQTGIPGDSFPLSGGGTGLIDYEGERDVKNNRALLQTFTVTSPIQVTDLYFGYSGGSGTPDDVQIRIFQVDDVHARGSDNDDDQILGFPTGAQGGLNTSEVFNETVTLTSLVTLASDFNIMHVQVTGLTLPALNGTAGYGISLYNPDNDNILPFKWAIERDDGANNAANLGPYLGGRGYSDNGGSATENEDWAFALDGVVVPEPSTYALFAGLATLGCILIRRRRR